MSFVVVNVATTAAIANAGTLTLSYPTGTTPGAFKGAWGHLAFAEGLSTLLVAPKDFTLTFNALASGITFTYNGSTPIPANSILQVQLDMQGGVRRAGYYDDIGNSSTLGRGISGQVARVAIGAPAVASTTVILATTAVAVTTVVALATVYVTDAPRALQVVSSNAGDTARTVTIRGFDEFGNAMTEVLTLNGATPVLGKKAFNTVVSYQASVALLGNLSIGTQNVFGLPVVLDQVGNIIKENTDGAVSGTAGTYVAADFTLPSGTTGDVRGTYVPNTAPNGTHYYDLFIFNSDPTGATTKNLLSGALSNPNAGGIVGQFGNAGVGQFAG